MANTSYNAAPSLVATNTTQQLSITADTKLNVSAPWLASGNGGQPDIATTVANTATAGSSSLVLNSNDNFPDSFPSVFQNGIYYLPPTIGRLAGAVTAGTNVIPFVSDNDIPNKTPIFVRLGSEILQVTSFGTTTVGSTSYLCLNTATNTASAHPDFTPIHLNSLPTDVQYSSITVPHLYLADTTVSGTMSGLSTTIASGSFPTTLGAGQTITTTTGGTTYLPVGTTAAGNPSASGLLALSNAFNTSASGVTFSNSATFAMDVYPNLLTSFTNVTSAAGGTNTKFSTLPIGSVITGTGLAASSYISNLDTNNFRLEVNNYPTAYTTGATFTSTLTFTCSTTAGKRFLTIKSITVNGVVKAKSGASNPTFGGKTLGYYIKVGAPITTTTGGGIAAKWVASIQPDAGTVYLSAAATATVTTATVTSVITMTANTGRVVKLTTNTSSDINKLIAINSSIADSAGATYVPAGTTISKIIPNVDGVGTKTEVWLSAAVGTTGAWTGHTATLSTTFTGSSAFTNQITGVASASNYRVGSLVYGNQYIPDNTTITEISGTTLTLSNTLTNGYTTISATNFKVGSSLNVGRSYSTLPVTPLPCQLPSGTTLYLTFGNYIQSITTSATAAAGATSISVTSFQPRYNFATTSYSYGVAQTSTGGYGYGANITTGLNSDLYPGQAIMLQANNATDYTTTFTVKSYTRSTSRTIEVQPFVSKYAYDGQSLGFSTSGTFTAGGNTITSVGSTGGLAVGQQLFSTALPTTAQYFITAISGSTVTISDNATSSGSLAFSVYATTFTASYPMTVDTGNAQEVVYPISLPTGSNGAWSVNLSAPTSYQHNNGVPFVYYHWPVPIKAGDVTYRPDFGKFLMWDGFQWRTARVNSVRGVYSILGAVGGGDRSDITLFDPKNNMESAADTFAGTPSTDYATYHGGARANAPDGGEWTGETLLRTQLHLKVKVPQSKSVGFRSLALESTYKAAPTVSSIHFTPGDNLEIAPDITNSVFWYYSDMENEPQTGWEVKIFDDYTYNRSDFSPDNNSITPFWHKSGADDSAEVEITGAHGWVNGERYWAYVRVAKQFHQKQWWGDWNYQKFVATVDQPSQPIMSIYTDNTNSVNKLAIQSTDNLLGDSNGTFAEGPGQWQITASDTASTGIVPLIQGLPLAATLATSGAISSLPVGATGYVVIRGALSGTGGGTFKVASKASGGTDALGFPTGGKFWVTIDSEKILVINQMDGDNTGDTFQIVTRGYLGTTAASHALGATVLFGLQNDIFVGTVANLTFHKHTTVTTKTTTTAKVRNYNGQAARNAPKSRVSLNILTQTQGSDRNATDRVLVSDTKNLISSKDVGSTVVLSLRHLHSADKVNVITSSGHVTANAIPDEVLTGNGVREVEMKIKSVQDIWDDSVHKAGKINIATVTTQVAGTTKAGDFHHAIGQLSVNPLVAANTNFLIANNAAGNACVQHNFIPSGSTVKISANSIHFDGPPAKDLPAASMQLHLTKDWHPTDRTIHFRPIVQAPGFGVGQGFYIIPRGSIISWAPPVQFTGRKVVHFTGKYTDKRGFAGQKLAPGDGFYIIKGQTWPAIKNTATGYHNQTKTVSTVKHIDIDSTQDFVVDFITQPTVSTGGVLGTLTSSSFVIGTGASYAYNAIAFSVTPGAVSGAYVSTPGLPPNSTVRANPTTVVGGTYAGYFAVTFNDSSGTQTNVTAQNGGVSAKSISSITSTTSTFTVNTTASHGLYAGQNVTIAGVTGATYTPYNNTWTVASTPTGTSFTVTSTINPGSTSSGNVTNATASTVSSPAYTGITASFTPSNSLIIPAGSQSIPIRPAIPKFPYQQNLPISFRYPAYYGSNALAVDPTTGTGLSTDISEISLYPVGWIFSDQNPVAVNVGQSYGFAAFSKVITGSGTPTFSPRVDWYDEVGSLLKSSYGTESLGDNGHTVGSTNSVTIGTQMNTSASIWGQSWNPVAMVAIAPTIALGTATFTSLSSSTGTLTLASAPGFTIKANATLTDASGTPYTVTSDTATTTVSVRFTSGITVPSSMSLTIKATRAVPVLRWTGVKSGDVYGVSGAMFNALNAPSLGSNSKTSTEIPKLSSAITVAAGKITNAFPIPSTTPLAGANSLYLFDPVGDFGTREAHFGGNLNTLWTNSTTAVAVGATQVQLASVEGLAVGVSLIFQYGSGNEETVIVDSSWSGGAIVPVAAPYFTQAHAKGVRVYSYTAGLASELTGTQAVNTPVAVFNFSPDGYIAADRSAYQYKVEKSEDGGVTWQTLRHGNALKADDSGVAYITDFEAVPGATTYYRARATHYVPPNGPTNDYTVTGPPSQGLLANTITNNNWWIASTSDDTLRFPILVKTGYSETQRHPSGVFYPLGSSRPVTLAGVPTGRDGSITITWTDLDNFENFLSLLNKGETLVLTNPVESDRKYIFINQDISITHNAANSPYREISINYVEAAPPAFGYTYGS